jgi:hypothetical protein
VNREVKVAAVLSDTSLVIAAGTDQGVQNGARVLIWEDREIADPDSQEYLGTVRITLARAKVIEAQEKLSVVQVDFENPGLNATVLGRGPNPTRRFTQSPIPDPGEVRVRLGQLVTVAVPNADSES